MLLFAIILVLNKEPFVNKIHRNLFFLLAASLMLIAFHLFLSYEWIVFNLKNRTYRKYVNRLGIKFGEWQNLDQFDMICLLMQFNVGSGRNGTNNTVSRIRSYEINLAAVNREALLLAECKTYKEAQILLEEINHYLKLQERDFVKEKYTQARR